MTWHEFKEWAKEQGVQEDDVLDTVDFSYEPSTAFRRPIDSKEPALIRLSIS